MEGSTCSNSLIQHSEFQKFIFRAMYPSVLWARVCSTIVFRGPMLRLNTFLLAALLSIAAVLTPAATAAQNSLIASGGDSTSYGIELQGFQYPYPVAKFDFSSQRQTMHMAYMDVHPTKPNGRTAVLLHGKNFCAATWKPTIDVLVENGYRIVAPDQIGFCKSTKPEHYQYTFQQLARNTHALLASLGLIDVTLIGHSTGGMLAVRYALMYPGETKQMVLVDPIGLEDWKTKGVPSISVDEWYARELKTNADNIRRYEQNTYYAGQWSTDYEPWVQMLAGLNAGPGKELVAWNSALLYDMIYTQPVFYELNDISVPTLLMIGTKTTQLSARILLHQPFALRWATTRSSASVLQNAYQGRG